MAYPTGFEPGDVVGRNLVSRPAFPTLDRGAWTDGTVADNASFGGNRLGIDLSAGIQVAATFTPGATYDLVMTAAGVGTGNYVFLSASSNPGSVPAGAHQMADTTAYIEQTATLTAPSGGTTPLFLVFKATQQSIGLGRVRLDESGSPLTGYFDGDTPDTAEETYAWDSTAYGSATTATTLITRGTPPDGGGDDGGGDPVTGSEEALRVAAFLGQPDNQALVDTIEEHVSAVTSMVRSYTRDQGFNGTGQPNAELEAVITAATARMVANPEQLPYDVGGESIRGAFSGWTLAETFVLNRFRKRAI